MTIDNVCKKEIENFSSLANQWWDKEGPLKTLHHINPTRLEYVLKFEPNLENKAILDIGCGAGIFTEQLAEQNAFAYGIDMSEKAIEVARLHARKNKLNIEYKITTIEDFSIENSGKFDIITCLEMLEHVPDPESIIKHILLCLKKNGSAFFSTINRNLKSYLTAIVGAEYLLKIVPYGTHTYEKFITPSEIVRFCENNNGAVHDISGMKYSILTESAKLTDNPDVNYLIYVKKQS